METESRRRNMETSSNGLRFCEYDSIPLLLNAKDIMHLLGLSRTNVYYLLNADDFPAIVIGKRRLVHKEKLFDWLEAHEQKASGKTKKQGKTIRTV